MRRLLMAVAVAATIGVATVRAESIVQILDGAQFGSGCDSVLVNIYTSSAKTTWVGGFQTNCTAHTVSLAAIGFSAGQQANSHYAEADYYDGAGIIAESIVLILD